MKKTIILTAIFFVLSSFTYAQDLSEYPDYFIDEDELNVVIVVGDKAPATHVLAQTRIALSLSSLVTIRSVNLTKLASEIDEINQNIISIGNACDNEVSARILQIEDPCDIEPGNAKIELISNNFVHIVLNTYSDEEIKKAAEVLSNYEDYDLEGNVFEIEGIETVSEEEPREKSIGIIEDDETVPELFQEDEISETEEEKEAFEQLEFEEEGPQPILREEDDIIKKIIAWFLSLFSFLR